jgi:cysteinyl-tRNA synthetase
VDLHLFNTLTRSVDPFVAIDADDVRMFVCGPTVYGPMHVGHAKTYTQFDLIAAVLRTRYPSLRYVQNITDIDDKIIAKAAADGIAPEQVAARFEDAYRTMMGRLGNTQVDAFIRAHDHVDAVIDQVRRLIETGHAYVIDGDGVYFDLSTFPRHGQMARRSVEPDETRTRLVSADAKRNPGDFVVWKFHKPGDPSWEAPFGAGRPGWHIEDTAITEQVFGPSYDLHGGATDLIFPHHEAEIAQMESLTGAPLVNYWMHTGLLQVDGKKMGKSLANFVTVEDLLARWDARTVRYAFVVSHYRSTMELDDEVLTAAEEARRRVENFYRHTAQPTGGAADVWEGFWSALLDDINTPRAFAHLFAAIRSRPSSVDRATLDRINALVGDIFDFSVEVAPEEVWELVRERETARATKDWAAADRAREAIAAQGWLVRDTPDGPVLTGGS